MAFLKRARQAVKERTGRAQSTRYSAEFEEQLWTAETLMENTARIVTRMGNTMQVSLGT